MTRPPELDAAYMFARETSNSLVEKINKLMDEEAAYEAVVEDLTEKMKRFNTAIDAIALATGDPTDYQRQYDAMKGILAAHEGELTKVREELSIVREYYVHILEAFEALHAACLAESRMRLHLEGFVRNGKGMTKQQLDAANATLNSGLSL